MRNNPNNRESDGDDLIFRNNAEPKRGYLIGAGMLSLLLGIAIGLIITWGFWPVEFKNADLADLRPAIKDDYVRMISAAYELTGDLPTAQRRIQALKLTNPIQTFDSLIAGERKNLSNSLAQDSLIHLAQALGLKVPYTAERAAPGAPTPITVYVVATPVSQVPSFRLVEHVQLTCTEESDTGHLRIFVKDSAGKDLPNVAIEIRSDDTTETIYTGLKPEHGIGYADYETTPGKYTVTILNADSDVVSELTVGDPPTDCKTDRGKTPRGWKLVFQQK
jgi:tRNA threonylcarbamoyladenosine modification (KEOPS) complex  Pcc1 subunit